MKEPRLKICLSLFLVLSLGVMANILVLQPMKPGQTTTAQWSSGLGTLAGSDNAGAGARGGLTEIASELRRLGYLPPTATTNNDLVIRAALLNYQRDAGLPPTAAPDAALLARLIMQQSRPTKPRQSTFAVQSGTDAARVVAGIQRHLQSLGYTIAQPDGRFNEETRRAIREFEMDKGLAITGSITAALVLRLQSETKRS